MKKTLSVKARVSLWYTGFLLVLILIGVAYLFAFSGQVFLRQIRTQLIDAVADTVRDTAFERGELEDEEMDFYRNGVFLYLYDTDGRLIAPRTNQGIQVDAVLEDQQVKTVGHAGEQYLVYDLYAVQDEVPFWTRGIVSIDGVEGTLRGMLLLAVAAVPVLAAVAWWGGWRITKRAFSTVEQMAHAADTITSGKDLSQRIPDNGSGDELSHLSRTFNTMLGRLQASFETERRFTSDVSHELRTPTAVILSQCEYGLSGQAGEGEKTDALRAILRQAQRMSAMISQLLLLARAERGKFTPDWETLDFSMLCDMCAQELSEGAKEAGVSLSTHLDAVRLVGDSTLLIRMVTNLLSNAIRYRRESGGRVEICLRRGTGESCILKVKDNGIGIRREDLPHIWERFYRADASRTGDGSGLGLPMVAWIVKLHGGQIAVRSIYGKGTVFRVTLPLGWNGKPLQKG